MAGYYDNSCGNVVPPHNCDPCADREFARIGTTAWIHKDAIAAIAADPTNAALWIAGQVAGTVIVLPETHGELSDPSPVEGQGYGRKKKRILGFDFTATVYDPNYADNCDHYNGLMLDENYYFVYLTSSKLHITQVPVTVTPTAPIADDVTAEVVWKIKVEWSYNQNPCPTDIPAGVFDDCYVNS